MPKPLVKPEPARSPSRPFPWFCPKCRRKEVRGTTIRYQCQRLHEGRLITVVVAGLAVPQCGHCGEMVFDYEAEEQVNRAFQAQVLAIGNGSRRKKETKRRRKSR